MAIPKKIMRKVTAASEDDITKALSVVLAIKQSRDIFVDALIEGGSMPPRLHQQVSKIERWADECINCIAKKCAFTETRERAFLKKIKALNDSRQKMVGSCSGSTFNWTAWIYALDVLLWDTKACMKPVTKKPCWRYLCMTWGTLMEWMLFTVKKERMCSGLHQGFDAEDMGMEIYKDVFPHFNYSLRGVA